MFTLRALCVALLLASACAFAQMNRTTADLLQQGDANTIADAGASDAYTGCPLFSIAAYKAGMSIWLKPNTANTGAASINVCGLGVKSIKQSDGTTDPSDGQLATGAYQLLTYDGTVFRIPAGSGGSVTASSISSILASGLDLCISDSVSGSNTLLSFDRTCLEPYAYNWAGVHTYTPSSTQSITAVGDTVLANANNVAVSPTSSLTLTSTPTIANGTNGQVTTICNVNTSNTLTLQDEANLTGSNIRNGGSNVSIGPRACRTLIYSTALGDWSALGGSSTSTTTDDIHDVTKVRIRDEFSSPIRNSNTVVGDLGWKGSGTGVLAANPSGTGWADAVLPQVQTVGIDTYKTLHLDDNPQFLALSTHTNWEVRFTIQTDQYFSTEMSYRIGFADGTGMNPSNFIGLRYHNSTGCAVNASDSVYQWEVRTGGTSVLTPTVKAFAGHEIMTIRMRSTTAGTILASYSVAGGSYSSEVSLSSLPSSNMMFVWTIGGCDGSGHTMKMVRFSFSADGLTYR